MPKRKQSDTHHSIPLENAPETPPDRGSSIRQPPPFIEMALQTTEGIRRGGADAQVDDHMPACYRVSHDVGTAEAVVTSCVQVFRDLGDEDSVFFLELRLIGVGYHAA